MCVLGKLSFLKGTLNFASTDSEGEFALSNGEAVQAVIDRSL